MQEPPYGKTKRAVRLVGYRGEWPELSRILPRIGYSLCEELCAQQTNTGTIALALVSAHATPNDYRRALRLGADTIVEIGASPTRLRWLLDTTAAGYTTIPTSTAQALASRLADPPHLQLDDHDLHLIRLVAEGTTLTVIAEELGFSERHIRRLLNRIWTALQAESRIPAIVSATRWGLLE